MCDAGQPASKGQMRQKDTSSQYPTISCFVLNLTAICSIHALISFVQFATFSLNLGIRMEEYEREYCEVATQISRLRDGVQALGGESRR